MSDFPRRSSGDGVWSFVSTKKCFDLDATKAWSWIIARMSTDTNTKIHKYLDHCTCDEHEEKKILGLHGAVDRLLLTDHHIQLDSQKKRSENGLLLYGAYISLASKGFITTSLLSPHLTTFYTFYPSSFYSSPAMEIKSQVPFRVVGAKK